MNKLYLFAIALCCLHCIGQTTDRRLNDFKSRFELITLPINFTALTENANLVSNSNKKQLSAEEILEYVLDGSQHQLEYKYEKYDMETGDSKGFETRDYKFYPVYRIEKKELLLFITLRTSINNQCYILSVYNPAAKTLNGTIEINKLEGEDEYKLYQSSYLDENLLLKIFRYDINPAYLKNLKTESNKTIITESSYQIGGHVELIGKQSKISQCSVSDFYLKNKKCNAEDPMTLLPDK